MPEISIGDKFYTQTGEIAEVVSFTSDITSMNDYGQTEEKKNIVWSYKLDAETYSSIDLKKEECSEFFEETLDRKADT